MTLQEAFDTAYRGLEAQGFEGSFKGGECAYRGEKGTRCAIGHLMPKHVYRRVYEGAPIDNPDLAKAVAFIGINAAVLRELQQCHDSYPAPKKIKANLAEFARRYSLTIPEATP